MCFTGFSAGKYHGGCSDDEIRFYDGHASEL
jgi:hypothetical protein